MGKHTLNSSTLKRVEYREGRVLKVEFRDGRRTKYFKGVPLEVYEALMASDSKGTYFNDHIDQKYEYEYRD